MGIVMTTAARDARGRFASRDVPEDDTLVALLLQIALRVEDAGRTGLARIAAGGLQDVYDATVAYANINPNMETT